MGPGKEVKFLSVRIKERNLLESLGVSLFLNLVNCDMRFAPGSTMKLCTGGPGRGPWWSVNADRRLRVVPHFSSGIVGRAKRERSRFARPTIPEEKWGTTRSLR